MLRNSLVGRAVRDVPRAVTRGAQGDRDGLRPVGGAAAAAPLRPVRGALRPAGRRSRRRARREIFAPTRHLTLKTFLVVLKNAKAL